MAWTTVIDQKQFNRMLSNRIVDFITWGICVAMVCAVALFTWCLGKAIYEHYMEKSQQYIEDRIADAIVTHEAMDHGRFSAIKSETANGVAYWNVSIPGSSWSFPVDEGDKW